MTTRLQTVLLHHWGGGWQRFLSCNFGFCSAKVAPITRQYILNNAIVAVNIRYSIVSSIYSNLIDTKNVVTQIRVHARAGMFDLSIPLGSTSNNHPNFLELEECKLRYYNTKGLQ